MNKNIIKSVALLMGVSILASGCSKFHVEIPITSSNDTSETEKTDSVEHEDLIEKLVETINSTDNAVIEDEVEGEDTTVTEESNSEAAEEVSSIGSFEIVDDVKVTKHINLDVNNKSVSVYDIDGQSLVNSSFKVDRTKKEECVLKIKNKDTGYDSWVYINENGENREKPWETGVITDSLYSVYTADVDYISGSDYTGNYTQIVEPIVQDSGETVYKIYNDTYVSKRFNSVLLTAHLMNVKVFDEASYNEQILSGRYRGVVTTSDIETLLSYFSFVDAKEVTVVEKQFNFVNILSFSDKVLTGNKVSDLPFNVVERVVSGGETLNTVEVPDRENLELRVKNTDLISKSINQCNMLSLTYSFNEDSDYDVLLFDYLAPNTSLSDVDISVLKYDSYYIDGDGTGYVIYKYCYNLLCAG
jgi:hypothetical protein